MDTKDTETLLDLFNHKAPIAQTFGLTLSYADDGSAVVEMPYNPALDRAMGGIHGGVYATLLDNATWFAAAAAQESVHRLSTSDLTIHFLRPASRTRLRAVGRVIKAGKRQSVAEGYLYDGDGNLIGHAVGTFVTADMPRAPEDP